MKKAVITITLCLLSAIASFAQTRDHTVQRGETLTSIADQYGISEAALKEANPQSSSFIYVGMKLTIPGGQKEDPAPDATSVAEPALPKESSSQAWKEQIAPALENLSTYAERSGSFYAFLFSGGFGAGVQASPFEGIPAGATMEIWSHTKARNISFSVDAMPVIPIAMDGNLRVLPQLGIGYHSLHIDGKNEGKKSIFLRICPSISYVLPQYENVSVRVGYLYNTYNNTSGNIIVGLSYRFH